MPYVLGIDIGGANTTAAVSHLAADGWSLPELVHLGPRSHAVASVLHLAADGSLAVGDPVHLDPGRVARGFVRRVGDDVPLIVGGEPCTAQALTAVLAMWVAERVAAWEGGPAEQIVISHPARWGPYRRAVLREALAEIGLPGVTLLPEPVVAAESHAAHGGAAGTLAVYSLGASEFEASVVRWSEGFGFRPLRRTAPVDQCGGVDIDEALAGHVQAALGADFRALRGNPPQARLAVYGLRRECVRAKERLSAATETEVLVPLPRGQVQVPVTRSELAELARPALQVTVDMLVRTIGSSGVVAEQLDGILLVGGAARMPLVGELIAAQLPAPLTVEPEPRGLAATGAAVAASKIAAPAPQPPAPPPMWTEPSAGDEPPAGQPPPDAGWGRAGGEPAAGPGRGPVGGSTGGAAGGSVDGPPPRPPVRVTPLKLSRTSTGHRRFGLVGGRS